MGQRVDIQQPTNHFLVLRVMLFRLMLEEIDAFLTQSNRNFYRILLEYKLLWRGQKIRHNL